jgi:hypothetical protein
MSMGRYVDSNRQPRLQPFDICLTIFQTILLTGASEGMGKSVAIQLSRKGANIIIVSRNVGKLEAALAEIQVSPSPPSLLTQLTICKGSSNLPLPTIPIHICRRL